MFGVFVFVLKLGMQYETAQNPIHCIQMLFISIGRFKLHNIYFLFIEMRWETDVVKKMQI